MLSSETTRLTPVLNRLSTLTMNLGEKTGIVNHFEARSGVPRMMEGVYSFKRQWETEPARREELRQSVIHASEVYTQIEKRHTHIQEIWNNRRSEAEMKRLEADIKAKRLLLLLDTGKQSIAASDRLRFELAQLESEQAMARKSRLDMEKIASEQQNSHSERLSTTESASLNNAIKRAQNEEIMRVMAAETQKAYLEAQEAYKTKLTGYLFVRNKEEFVKVKSVEAFDEVKERRQVEGVIRSQFGEHLHMGTGEGKSTVVLPISALVEAATSKRRAVVVGSANGLLVSELKQNTMHMADIFDELKIGGNQLAQAHDIEGNEDRQTVFANSGLIEKKNKSTLSAGEIEKGLKIEEKKRYWEGVVRSINSPPETNTYLEQPEDMGIHLYFSDEKQLVWQWMENKRVFEANCPKILMDEAHVAFDKKGTYSKTAPSEALIQADIQRGASEWLANYMVSGVLERMKEGAALSANEGEYELSERAKDRVRAINIGEVEADLEQKIKHGKKHRTTKGYINAFYEGVEIVAEYAGVKKDGKQAFTKRLLQDLKRHVDFPNNVDASLSEELTPYGTADYFEEVGKRVGKYMKLRDKIFTQRGDKMYIRDAYTDELLEGHRYEPQVQVAIMAITKKFEPIKREVAHSTSTYVSFVHAVQDKFVAFSGTLMYPDARKGTMKKGSFAKFLESTTHKKVHMIESTEIKPFPRPQIGDVRNGMFEGLIQDLDREFANDILATQARRPTLLVDFNGLTSTIETYDRMRTKYGDDRVRLLLSRPTGGDIAKEIEYKQQLDEYRRQLAEGKIDILISSGSAALGVNFEKSTGQFPDLRTVMVGLPDSEQRVVQTIGRRRMMENGTRNHLWHISIEDIELQLSHLEQAKKSIFIGLNEKSRQQMIQELKESRTNPEKALDLVLTVMEKVNAGRASDTDSQRLYDQFLDGQVIPYATSYMKRRIASEQLHYDEKTIDEIIKYDELIKKGVVQEIVNPKLRIQSRILNTYFTTLGLPSTIYNDIQSESWLAQLQEKDMFDVHFTHEDLQRRIDKLAKYVLLDPEKGFGINVYLDNWYELGIDSVESFAHTIDLERVTSEITESVGERRKFAVLDECDIPPFDPEKAPDEVLFTDTNPRTGETNTLVSRYVQLATGENTHEDLLILVRKYRGPGMDHDVEYTYFDPVKMAIINMKGVRAKKIDMKPVPITYATEIEGDKPQVVDFPLTMLSLS